MMACCRAGARLLTLLIVLSIVPGTGRASAVSKGVAWLTTHQDGSGLWGSTGLTPIRDATTVVEALRAVGADSSGVVAAVSAINGSQTVSSDLLARKVIANAVSATIPPLSGLVGQLVARNRADGGWGYDRWHESQVLETALALKGLCTAGYADTAVLGLGVRYLETGQNLDHGWAFTHGDTSRALFSASALLGLSAARAAFPQDTVLANCIKSGKAWLKGQGHADGGFGTGSASNPYESALAIMAMSELPDSVAQAVTRAQIYLIVSQRSDGSWNSDAYSTALAVQALGTVALLDVEPSPPPVFRFAVSPNPMRGVGSVSLSLPQAERIDLTVYDVAGRRVRTLKKGTLGAGRHTIAWDLRSDAGPSVASGAYYLRLARPMQSTTRKIVVVK